MTPADPLDLVRAFYQALNRSDLDALVALYHPSCTLEHVFLDDAGVYEGLDALRAGWAREFGQWAGALTGGSRIEVDRVAGIETGWGWVRADWRLTVRDAGDVRREVAGHSHFWVEDGRIRRHRSVETRQRAGADPGPRTEGPGRSRVAAQPVVGVGAVTFMDDGRVVLVRRQHEPLAGQWSLPGGKLELGETLEAGIAREMREETGLVVDVGPVVDVFDRILVDERGDVRYHFVLVDFLCRTIGGTLAAGSDVVEAVLASPAALEPYRLAGKARDVIARAVTMRRPPG